MRRRGIDKDGLPTGTGVYQIKIPHDPDLHEIEVYKHPIKGLCCFSEDFGSGGTGVCEETDCHVSVQMTGLEFITKVRNLNKNDMD